MSVPATPRMTTEELLAMHDDGVERWLIRGQLREKPTRLKDRLHAAILARLGRFLSDWNDGQCRPTGEVLGGQVGCRVRRQPDSLIGIDLAYVSLEVPNDSCGFVDGSPLLAVEILSPDDVIGDVDEKIDEYLATGVRVVWVIDPHDRTVTIYRPDDDPELVNDSQELTGEPELPCFRVPLALLFS